MILLDTSGLLAALDSSQRHHREAAASLVAARPPLLLSPFVLAELDYLVASRVGSVARTSLLEEVERGAYLLEPMTSTDVTRAHAVIGRYADLEISLADASLVVLAERHRVREVLSLDERHFRVLTVCGKPFRVLPADA
ncbi:MAG TPA: PIN domain-containing protein [Solirubrobacteraceae bacterium]|nr:PIN domain-containing protein [Solirubrobacteraceae bacterium]